MPHCDQLLREERDDPLGASVELRRDGFVEWGNLGYTHRPVVSFCAAHCQPDRGINRAALPYIRPSEIPNAPNTLNDNGIGQPL